MNEPFNSQENHDRIYPCNNNTKTTTKTTEGLLVVILSILDTSQQLQKVHYTLDRLKQVSSHKDKQIYVFMDLTMCQCTSILHTFINGYC